MPYTPGRVEFIVFFFIFMFTSIGFFFIFAVIFIRLSLWFISFCIYCRQSWLLLFSLVSSIQEKWIKQKQRRPNQNKINRNQVVHVGCWLLVCSEDLELVCTVYSIHCCTSSTILSCLVLFTRHAFMYNNTRCSQWVFVFEAINLIALVS